jgi:hypothetical protein
MALGQNFMRAARAFAGWTVLAAALSGLSAAHAQEIERDPGAAEQLVGEGLAKMLQALDLLLKTVPQYAAPEVQPNGDIIIRRLHPEEDMAPDDPDLVPENDPARDSTET